MLIGKQNVRQQWELCLQREDIANLTHYLILCVGGYICKIQVHEVMMSYEMLVCSYNLYIG